MNRRAFPEVPSPSPKEILRLLKTAADAVRSRLRSACLITLSLLVIGTQCFAQEPSDRPSPTQTPVQPIAWKQLEPGLEIGSYYISRSQLPITSEVVLVRVSLERFAVKAGTAKSLGIGDDTSTAKEIAARTRSSVAINSQFFDTNNLPLGLLISGAHELNPLHRGGNLLTGIFTVKGTAAEVIHRSRVSEDPSAINNLEVAVQAGPRLIAGGAPLPVAQNDPVTRRSGVAIPRNEHQIILFATRDRFPGATLKEIQEMLLSSLLDVSDALNFDGGGSSQLYVSPESSAGAPVVDIWGGDRVPSFLVIVKKQSPVLRNKKKR